MADIIKATGGEPVLYTQKALQKTPALLEKKLHMQRNAIIIQADDMSQTVSQSTDAATLSWQKMILDEYQSLGLCAISDQDICHAVLQCSIDHYTRPRSSTQDSFTSQILSTISSQAITGISISNAIHLPVANVAVAAQLPRELDRIEMTQPQHVVTKGYTVPETPVSQV